MGRLAWEGMPLPSPRAARECPSRVRTGEGGEVFAGCWGGCEGADVPTGDLECVEQSASEAGIDLAGGDGGKEQGDRELDRLGVFERREVAGGGSGELGRPLAVFQEILHGLWAQGTDFGCADGIVSASDGPVEITEAGAGDGGRLATAAVGLDVPADGVLISMGVHWFLDPVIKCEGPQAASVWWTACGLSFSISTSILPSWA